MQCFPNGFERLAIIPKQLHQCVDDTQKISASSALLCTAEVESIEGRKVRLLGFDLTSYTSVSPVLCSAFLRPVARSLITLIHTAQIWMRAIVSDGPDGKVFATARALFVAPKPQRLLKDVLNMIFAGKT